MKKLIVAVAALAMMAGSAYAADWNFYGSARVDTFWSQTDTYATTTTAAVDGDTVVSQSLMATSRIGANVKVSDELSGRFEYGASGGSANVRLLYGEWNFGAGTLLIGQDYTPIRFPGSNQAYGDSGLGGWGELSQSRSAQLKLRFGGFQIAAIAPNTDYIDSASNLNEATDSEIVVPLIAAKYIFSGDNWQLSLVGGYQTFDVEQGTANDDITSYVLGAGGSVNVGAFTLTGAIHGGENLGNISDVYVSNLKTTRAAAGSKSTNENDGKAIWNATTGKVTDNEGMGFKLTAAYAINDMFGLEVGFGQMQTEYDNVTASDDDVASYYFQAPITMAPGVIVVPEIGVVDYKEAGQDEITYFGAKWQINF